MLVVLLEWNMREHVSTMGTSDGFSQNVADINFLCTVHNNRNVWGLTMEGSEYPSG